MNREIPQQEKQVGISASDFKPIEDNIQSELNTIAQATIVQAKQLITKKLENDDFQFRKLASESIEQVYEQNKTNPDQLRQEFSKINSTLLQGVPFALRNKSEEWLFSNSSGYIAKAKANEMKLLNDQAKANSLSDISIAGQEVNQFAGGFFSNNPELQIESTAGINAAYSRLFNALSKKGIDGMPLYSAEDQFKSMEAFNKNLIVSGIHGNFNDLESQEEKIELLNKFRNKEISVSLQTLAGITEPVNVANMLKLGEFESVINYMTTNLKKIDDGLTEAQLESAFNLADQGIQVAPIGNAKYTKVVNDIYQNKLIPSMIGLSPNDQVSLMSDFVEKHGAPSAMVNQVKAWSSMGDDRQYSTSVSFLKKLIDINSPQLSKFDGSEIASARYVAENLNNDVGIDRLRKLANEKFGPQTKEGYKLREDEFNDTIRNLDLPQLMADFLDIKPDKLLSQVAQINSNAMVNVRAELKAQYLLTGNLKDSLYNTKVYVNSNYGLSRANGNTFMQYPPEKENNIRELTKDFTNIFTRGKYDDWAKNQFGSFLTGIGIENKTQREGSFIDSDEITKREKSEGLPLSYRVYTMDPSGGYNIARFRFTPDIEEVVTEINDFLNTYPTIESRKEKIQKEQGPFKNMGIILSGYEQLYN